MKRNTVICGGNEREAWMHARAWTLADDCTFGGVYCADHATAASRATAWSGRVYENFEKVLADTSIHAVVLLDTLPDRTERALAALAAGKAVLVGPPFAHTAAEADKLARAGRNTKGLLLSAEPKRFYPPFTKIEQLVQKRTVGRATSVRMRSIIAGRGGWDTWLNPHFKPVEPETAPDATALLFREAVEKISLAQRLLGPIEEIHLCRAGADAPPFTSVFTWKHRATVTYGALDVTFAPAMHIRSAYEPRDDNMEITGSSGIIWLTRESAQLRNEPTIHIYRGSNQFAYGHVEDDGLAGYTHCARHAAECLNSGRAPIIDPSETARAVACVEAAFSSSERVQV